MRAAAIDRRVRGEAKVLAREVRRALRHRTARLPEPVRLDLDQRASALDEARKRGDLERMRAELYPLDALVDEHLDFARKSTGREYVESIGVAVLIALMLRAFVIEAFKIPSGSMIPTMEIGDHIFVNKFIYGVRIPFTTIKFFEWRAPDRGEVIVFINPCEPDKDFIKRIVAVAGDTVEVRCDVLYVNGDAVPAELRAGTCEFWDKSESGGTATWARESCSLYVERYGGASYRTIHADDRPELDRQRATSTDRTYAAVRGGRDFPDRVVPDCDQVPWAPPDQRSPEQKARSRGAIEASAPVGDDASACAPRQHYVVPDGHVFVMGDNRANSSDSRTWGSVPLENIKGKALFIWWSSQPDSAGGMLIERIGQIVR